MEWEKIKEISKAMRVQIMVLKERNLLLFPELSIS
jgi:hypothetical protein